MSLPDLFLTIDVGTGSVRSALVDANGEILAIHAKEHDQIVPRPGWYRDYRHDEGMLPSLRTTTKDEDDS
ncbi:MAG TPA: FGGY family carbohydrate kinase [Chthoniobacterales bacterium]|nr:FGGY family carbohydrate kinase [Chthoniobacterales bacterium]